MDNNILLILWDAQSLATIIAGGLAFIAALATIIVSLVLKHKEKMNQYAITISKERALWINQTRELVSSLCAFCKSHGEELNNVEDIYEFERLRSSLLLRISPTEYIKYWIEYADKRNMDIKKRLLKEDKFALDNYLADEELNSLLSADYISIMSNIDYIRIIFSYVCKGEWDRVRSEAGEDRSVRKAINKNVRAIGGTANKEGLKAVIREYKKVD